jgi:hypothetical protein
MVVLSLAVRLRCCFMPTGLARRLWLVAFIPLDPLAQQVLAQIERLGYVVSVASVPDCSITMTARHHTSGRVLRSVVAIPEFDRPDLACAVELGTQAGISFDDG